VLKGLILSYTWTKKYVERDQHKRVFKRLVIFVAEQKKEISYLLAYHPKIL